MPLTRKRLEEIQNDALADDLPLHDQMLLWNENDAIAYFESGGLLTPNDELESAQSSADARTLRADDDDAHLAELANLQLGGALPLDDAHDDAVEDAMLDALMASVPVTARSKAGDDSPQCWPVRRLKDRLEAAGVATSGLISKEELVRAVESLPRADVSAGARSEPPDSGAATVAQDEVKLRRYTRKADDIKQNGDRAFAAADYAKAEGHYSKAIELHHESPLRGAAPQMLGTLLSNRSACRSHLKRFEEALEDGRAALRARPGWARAHGRIGSALHSLRRFDEARAEYERGLVDNPGSAELQRGLAAALGELGASAGAHGSAAEHKERGNSLFSAGQHAEAIREYGAAIAAAPKDETLYSNRSAAHAHLGDFRKALDDGKRAIALRPGWGKAYSRCGYAALSDADCEAAYWFYANGLRHEPRSLELMRGRDSALAALATASSARHARRLARCRLDAERPAARIFAVSDVHYDHPGAREWAASLSETAYRDDAIIVAGDVGDTFQAVRLCLRAFKRVFRRVFYCPGNHDMWIRPKGQHSDEPSQFADSVAKLIALWQLCDELEVDTGPCQLSPAAAVLPLDSWYSHLFDKHDPRPGTVKFDKYCVWPMGYDHAWRFMLSLNAPRLDIPLHGDVITFSHFLPRQELPIPGIHEMAKGVGTVELDAQLRRANSKLHIFGHTHINTTDEYDGVRYMQNALGYGISPGQKLCVVHERGRFKEYMA